MLLPLLTLIALASLGKRYGDSYIDARSRDELAPFVGPLTLGTLLLVVLVRCFLSPKAPRPLRYVAVALSYAAAIVMSLAGMIYWLAGAPSYWAWGTFALGVAVLIVVSLSRFAYDVSPHRS